MSEQNTLIDRWWATGDMPVRNASRLAFLIDGRMTMLELCLAFLRARHSIYITAWGLSPELLLVRGKHKCAGSTGSPEQEELLAWLRARGLAEEELHFWQHCDELNVTNVLTHAVGKGVDVRVLLWDTYPLPTQPIPDPKNVQDVLVTTISIGTNVGDYAYYVGRTRATNDFHGLGAFLIMNEQLAGGA